MDTVILKASGDAILCPVCQWAALVCRIIGYPGATVNTPGFAVWLNGCIDHICSQQVVDALRAAVAAIGPDRIGIQPTDIGTHSIRSGSAMAMYLGECPVYVIMMIGR